MNTRADRRGRAGQLLVILCLFKAIKVVREYQRLVVFRLGRVDRPRRARAW